jgi:hypothetical protein
MSERATRILFAPASGPGGSGEYYRALALARALLKRRPGCRIDFVVQRDAGVERDERFAYHDLDATPARAGATMMRSIDSIRPDLAVFDCTGRVAQFRRLRALGSKIAWFSDRPRQRRKGFRLRRMARVNLHVVVDADGGALELAPRERALLRLFPNHEVELVRGIVPEPDAGALAACGVSLPPADVPYAVFVAGGGGYEHDGRPVPEILVEAAEALHRRCRIACVVVMGPQYRGGLTRHDSVHIVEALPQAALGALLAGAGLAVTGAGSMLSAQVLASRVPAVMLAAGGNDQPERIRRLDEAGLARAATLRPEAIAALAAGLLADADQASGMVERQRRLGLDRAIDQVAGRLLSLADAAS